MSDKNVKAADIFEISQNISKVEEIEKATNDNVDNALKTLSKVVLESNDIEAIISYMTIVNHIKVTRMIFKEGIGIVKKTVEHVEDEIIREGE